MSDSPRQMTLTGGAQTRVGHWKHDDHDVYIGRGEQVTGGTAPEISDTHSMGNTPIGEKGWLGNPYPKEKYGRAECIERFREAFTERLAIDAAFREAIAGLAGETLGGWCQRIEADTPACHGEIIAEYADRLAGESDE